MKIDGGVMGFDLSKVPARAKALEELGVDGIMSAEVSNDPFLPLCLAAEHTERVRLQTSIAVAFARNPMLLAQMGHDLNAYSKGRFTLGLGSQIKPHITRRFSMPWSKPAARMRELILAMRSVWDCWYDGKPLEFEGDFYTHTLMTPMFTPPNRDYGAPDVWLAGVGPLMTEVAGEVADGLIAHAFTTPKYMDEVTMPALRKGLEKSGRSREDFAVVCPIFTVTGADEQQMKNNHTAVTRQIAFYASTPAYRPVLELHGWGDIGKELTRMSKQGKWEEMGTLITDDVLAEFAVVGTPDEVVKGLRERYPHVDRTVFSFEFLPKDQQRDVLARLQA